MTLKLKIKALAVAALLCVLPYAANAQKISALPAGTALVGIEIAPFVQSGATVKITADQIEAFTSAAMLAVANTWALDQSVPDEAYNAAAWNGSFEVPTKNAVRDAIESIVVSGVSDGDKGDITVSGTGTVWDIDSNATISGTTPLITITGTDPGAVGPVLKILHDSATPAASDVPFDLQVFAGADDEEVGRINYRLIDGGTGSEDGAWEFRGDIAGTSVLQAWLHTRVFSVGNTTTTPLIANIGGAFGTVTPYIQAVGLDGNTGVGVFRFGTGEARSILARSRGGSIGTYTVVNANDVLGEMSWQGADGDEFEIAAKISTQVDTTPGNEDMPGRLVFATTADGGNDTTDRMVIDSGGFVTIANGVNGTIGTFASDTPRLQIRGVSSAQPSVGLAYYGNDAFANGYLTAKSRGGTIDTYTIVQNNDNLGAHIFLGADGTDFARAAYIGGYVDGSPGNNDMPGRLEFFTSPDASATPASRMAVRADGTVNIGLTPASNTSFDTGADINLTPKLNVQSTDGASSFGIARYSNDVSTPYIFFAKSRGTSVGSYTIVQSGDLLGEINVNGADGSDLGTAAKLVWQVDGTPGNGDMPGRMVFQTTPDGSNDSTAKMIINNEGFVMIADFTPLVGESGVTAAPMKGWAGGSNPFLQVSAIHQAKSSIGMFDGANDSGAPILFLGKSRAGALDYTLVQNGDSLGSISFQGADNTNMMQGARIYAYVNGAPGDGNDIPTALVFQTAANGTEGGTTRMTMWPGGGVTIGDNEASFQGLGVLFISDAVPDGGDGGMLKLGEDSSNGNDYLAFEGGGNVATTGVCTLADYGSATIIPYSCMGSGQPTVTVDTATTFAITSSQISLACTGAETINTITGGVVGMRLMIFHEDTDCTIADDDDATAANAIDLTGTATNDVGAVHKVIELVYRNAGHWQQVSESDN